MSAAFKDRLQRRELAHVFCAGQLCHPKVIELVGFVGGYQAVWLDQEHAGLSITQIEEATRAARGVGLASFVRLVATDYGAVMRPLEAGAGGIMAAQVRTAEETAAIVRWAKFHPLGLRGVNGTGVDGRYGRLRGADYYRHANAETFVVIQIEHADAVANVEAIASVPGVDCLFVGPADLGQSLGIPGQWDHPRLWDAFARVAAVAKTAGLPWAILPRDAAYARRCVDLGCSVLSTGLDVWALARGLEAIQAEYDKALS